MTKPAVPTPIAFEIVSDAIKQCSKKSKKNVNYKDVANRLGLCPSSLWFPINGKRAWNADRWLATLQALGCLSYQGDHIIISSEKFKKFAKNFGKIEPI